MRNLIKFLKLLSIAIAVLIVLVLGIRLLIKIMPSKTKLNIMDGILSRNKSIHSATILIKDLKNNKEHRFEKGNFKEDKYYLASVTKLYVHSIIFQMIDEGLISYETKLSDVLAKEEWEGILTVDGVDHSGDITVSHLVNQTSGIPDYESDYKFDGKSIIENLVEEDFDFSFEDALEATKSVESLHKTGEGKKAYYSNLNPLLLSKIAEKITGKSFLKLLSERILSPNNLSSTMIISSPDDAIPVYYGDIESRPFKYTSSAPAAGGIIADVDDLMSFLDRYFNGNLFDISHLSKSEFRPIQFIPIKYGNGMMELEMGMLMSPFMPAPRIIGHSGSTGSFAFYQPESRVFITGTLNQAKTKPFPYVYGYINAIK